jgi:hypothetical protein
MVQLYDLILYSDIAYILEYNVLLIIRIINNKLYSRINQIIECRNRELKLNKKSLDFLFNQDLPLNIIKYYYRKNLINNKIFNTIIESANINNLEWLLKNGCSFDNETLGISLKTNNSKLVKWLKYKKCPLGNVLSYAVYLEKYKICEKLLTIGCKLTSNVFAFAITNPKIKIETLKWLKNKNCPYNSLAFENAVINENIKLIEWLISIKCPFGEALSCAALKGNIPIIKLLISKGCTYNTKTFENAALYNNIDFMLWLKEQNCPWNANTITNAVIKNNLNVVEWLLLNGCKGDVLTFHQAIKYNHFEMIILLKKYNCPWDEIVFEIAFNQAVNNNNFRVINWLKYNKCPTTNNYEYFIKAASVGNLKIMKWLKKHKYKMNEFVFNSAAENGNMQNILWLYKNGCKYNTVVYSKAVQTYNFVLMEWLENNNFPINVKTFNLNYYHYNNKELVLRIIKHGIYFKKISIKLKDDIDIANVAIEYNPSLYKFISSRLKKDHNIIKKCIDKDISIINDIPIIIINNKPDYLYNIEFINKIIYSTETLSERVILFLKKDYPINYDSLILAIKIMDLEVIKFLLQKCKLSSLLYITAINEYISDKNDGYNTKLDLEIINLLLSQNCPHDINVMNNAINTDNIEIIKSLINANCPYDNSTINIAINNNNSDIVKLLVDNKCSYNEKTITNSIDKAIYYNNMDLLL